MPHLYDPLITYLAKNNGCTLSVALTLLKDYKDEQSRYTAIHRLVQKKVLKREVRNKVIWLILCIHPTKFILKSDKPAEHDTTLNDIASLYRYMIRYGAQHYATAGRANIAAVAKLWLDQRRDLIQFLNLLVELIDDQTISQLEYKELEAGLKEANWYPFDYDALDNINAFIGLVNPPVDVDGEQLSLYSGLGLTKEDWESLRGVNSLRRINPVEESDET